jgi:hypothetical protein
MNPGVTSAFTWNGNTKNYALYATLVDSSKYTPDPYNDQYLSTAIATSGAEVTAANCTYPRIPVQLAAIAKYQKTSPTADYVIYPANASYPLSWTVNPSQTMTAGLIIFYWDLNVANSLISPLVAYAPSGSNNTYDSTSPLIAYGPFVDSSSGHNYWTTTTSPALVSYSYDTSFTGNSTILSSQVL